MRIGLFVLLSFVLLFLSTESTKYTKNKQRGDYNRQCTRSSCHGAQPPPCRCRGNRREPDFHTVPLGSAVEWTERQKREAIERMTKKRQISGSTKGKRTARHGQY